VLGAVNDGFFKDFTLDWIYSITEGNLAYNTQKTTRKYAGGRLWKISADDPNLSFSATLRKAL